MITSSVTVRTFGTTFLAVLSVESRWTFSITVVTSPSALARALAIVRIAGTVVLTVTLHLTVHSVITSLARAVTLNTFHRSSTFADSAFDVAVYGVLPVAVTVLGTTESEHAWLAHSFTVKTRESRPARTFASQWVTGGTVATLARQLAVLAIESGTARHTTRSSLPSCCTYAITIHFGTSSTVLAEAVVFAIGAVFSVGTCLRTIVSNEARCTNTSAVHVIAVGSVLTVADLLALITVCVRRTRSHARHAQVTTFALALSGPRMT